MRRNASAWHCGRVTGHTTAITVYGRSTVRGRLIWRWFLDVVDDDFVEWDFDWHQL